ncbi:unnamed protein product, partial [marine sediment metagenome]
MCGRNNVVKQLTAGGYAAGVIIRISSLRQVTLKYYR